nr:putative triple gene block protein 3 [Lolium latent virus]
MSPSFSLIVFAVGVAVSIGVLTLTTQHSSGYCLILVDGAKAVVEGCHSRNDIPAILSELRPAFAPLSPPLCS